ncbi:MAG: 30S ribosome-binding factor RbfA [Thermoguttaceae bacterium]|nr:30S ribosome-binding factor RbfA [Thermoguttaceae bacterium]
MPSRRVLKAAEAIREVVGMSILRDIQDPRVQGVTITYVEVSGDMQQAKIHVSIMGNETKQNLCLQGLQHAAGYFQRKIADRIQTRYTPRVQFVLDQGVKKSILVSKLLKEVLPPEEDKTEEAEAAEETVEEVMDETNNENG